MQWIDQSSVTWQGRDDGVGAKRFFQAIQAADINELSEITLLGFCSDEGVKRNLGRPGAIDGPSALRQSLANFPVHCNFSLADIGDIRCDDGDLETAQQKLANISEQLALKNSLSIVLGGGHEVAWGHGHGLFKAAFSQGKKIGVINLDAHLDLRPLVDGVKGSSGTPFRQLAKFCQDNNQTFHYCCIGVQPYANTDTLFATAKSLNVTMIYADEVKRNYADRVKEQIRQFCQSLDTVYLTLCMDVFAENVAPGVSAPQALGLSAEQGQQLLQDIIQSTDLSGFDIAELAPCYDQGQQTARLAAYLLNDVLHHYWQRKKQ